MSSSQLGTSTTTAKPVADAVDVTFTKDSLVVTLADGRCVSAPLEWFPRLLRATARQRRNWRFQANPDVDRADLIERLRDAMDAAKRGERCSCGAPIWIVGSAEVGLACFTCITGEAVPDNDVEIDLG